MSGLRFILTVEDMGAGTRFASLNALLADPEAQIYAPVAAALESSTKERFDTNVGPDGEAWEPSLRAKEQSGRTLTDQGHLRDSVHGASDPAGLEVGAADQRARIHQFGGEIVAKTDGGLAFRLADGGFRRPKKVTMPARPFIGLSADDEGVILRITGGALKRAVQ